MGIIIVLNNFNTIFIKQYYILLCSVFGNGILWWFHWHYRMKWYTFKWLMIAIRGHSQRTSGQMMDFQTPPLPHLSDLVTPPSPWSAMPGKNSHNLVCVKSKKLFLLLELFYNYKSIYVNTKTYKLLIKTKSSINHKSKCQFHSGSESSK
jgi:hypothetical protein